MAPASTTNKPLQPSSLRRLRRRKPASSSYDSQTSPNSSNSSVVGVPPPKPPHPPRRSFTKWLRRSAAEPESVYIPPVILPTRPPSRAAGDASRRSMPIQRRTTEPYRGLEIRADWRDENIPRRTNVKTPINYERRSTTTREAGIGLRARSYTDLKAAPVAAVAAVNAPRYSTPVSASVPGTVFTQKVQQTTMKLPTPPSSAESSPGLPPDSQASPPTPGRADDTFDAIALRLGYHDKLPQPKRPTSLASLVRGDTSSPKPVIPKKERVPLDSEFDDAKSFRSYKSAKSRKSGEITSVEARRRTMVKDGVKRGSMAAEILTTTPPQTTPENQSPEIPELNFSGAIWGSTVSLPIQRRVSSPPPRRSTDPMSQSSSTAQSSRCTSPIRRTLIEPDYPFDEDELSTVYPASNASTEVFHAVTADRRVSPRPHDKGISQNFEGIIGKLPTDAPARNPEIPDDDEDHEPEAYKSHSRSNSFLGGWKLALSRRTSKSSAKGCEPSEGKAKSSASSIKSNSSKKSTGSSWIHRRKGSFSSPVPPTSDEKKPPVPPKSATKTYRQEQNEFLRKKEEEKKKTKAKEGKKPVNPAVQRAQMRIPKTPSPKPMEAVAKVYSEITEQRRKEFSTFDLSLDASKLSPKAQQKWASSPALVTAPDPLTQRNLEEQGARTSFIEKLQVVEARMSGAASDTTASECGPEPTFRNSNSIPTPPADDSPPTGPVSLTNAVRQLDLLESKLNPSTTRPISPPDSRGHPSPPSSEVPHSRSSSSSSAVRDDDEDSEDVVTPLATEVHKPYHPPSTSGASSPGSLTPTNLATFNARHRSLPRPGPPPGHRSHHRKHKSAISPLRNEVGGGSGASVSSASSSGSYFDSNHKASKRSEMRGLERHSIAVTPTPKPGSPAAGAGAGYRPPLPPKPIAKLFVICCRCKYWHDLPSQMYRGMVEQGGATRCPYCLHGMEVGCCSGYTCVVYMHQKHH